MATFTRSLIALLPLAISLPGCSNSRTAPVATAPAAPVVIDGASLAESFLHFLRTNDVKNANAIGERLLDPALDPQKCLMAFESAVGGRDYRHTIQSAARRPGLEIVATKMITKLDQGDRALGWPRDRMVVEVARLSTGARGYQSAKDRLASAGPDALKVMKGVLEDPSQKASHPDVLKAYIDLTSR